MTPVHSPQIGEEEITNVVAALRAGEISGSYGRYIASFEEKFAEFCGCKYGVAVSSGSTALHLAVVLSGIERGDEVLVGACTNIASANAVVQEGGIVVPVDSDERTWCMDVDLLEDLVTPKTRAIMPVHVYGHPVDMRGLETFAREHGLFVIEDCAEAHGATCNGRRVGSFGDVGCFSFYANKPITTGEGGMLVTNDYKLADKARLLRNLAFTQPRFYHYEVGFNYRLTNIQAAIGCAQLAKIDSILDKKRQIAHRYIEMLKDVYGLRLPVEEHWATNIYWMFCVVLEGTFPVGREDFQNELLRAGIETRRMFCPMNLQPALHKRMAIRETQCPVAEDLWFNGLYLPSGCDLTTQDIASICSMIGEMACV